MYGHIEMGMGNLMNIPDLPMGFTMALLQESRAMDYFESLDAGERERIVNYIKTDNHTGEEAKTRIGNVVDSLSSNRLDFLLIKNR